MGTFDHLLERMIYTHLQVLFRDAFYGSEIFAQLLLFLRTQWYNTDKRKFILVLVKKAEAAPIAVTPGPFKASRKNLQVGIKYGELTKISFGIGIRRSKQRPRKEQFKWNSNAFQYSQRDYSGHLPCNQKGSSYILEGHLDKRQVLNLDNRCSSGPEKRRAEHGRQSKRPLDDDPFSGAISAPLLSLHAENNCCSDVVNQLKPNWIYCELYGSIQLRGFGSGTHLPKTLALQRRCCQDPQ